MMDFDRFMQERERRTIEVRVFDRLWQVPGEIPAWIPLAMAGGSGDASMIVARAAEVLLGRAFIDETAKHPRFSVEDLKDLVITLFKLINGQEPEERDAGVDGGPQSVPGRKE